MKRALIIILTTSLIITLFFFVFFFKNFDKRENGIGFEYFKDFGTSFNLPFRSGNSVDMPFEFNFGISEMVNENILNGKFTIGTLIEYWKYFNDSSVPALTSVPIETYVYVSHRTDKNIAEGLETVRHWTKPFIKLKAYGRLFAHSENAYDWSYCIDRLEVVLDSELLIGVFSNNLAIFQKSLVSFDEINNAFDFVEYLGTLLKELFIFLANIMKDITRFLT